MNKIIGNQKWTIGADPEMFCKNDQGYVAVQNCGITGTKESPQLLPMGGNVQRDNVAIEFAILPTGTTDDFVQAVGDTLLDLVDILPDGISVDITPSANFPEDQLNHEECLLFGCDPDINAWTTEENKPPPDAENSTFRSCGGHIHVGFVAGSGHDFLQEEEGKFMTVRMMDSFHGIISTVLDSSEAATNRRELYGKPGCCRLTEYGIEYRTLSNYWIKHPKLVELMYSLTEDVMQVMRNQQYMEILGSLGRALVEDTISKGDFKMALNIVTGFLFRFMSDQSQLLFEDCRSIVSNPIDTLKEWKELC